MYIGGAEHAVLHLLYSRFLTKVFYDLGLVDFDEPVPKFRAHGLLIAGGAKMSKSRGNIVTPDVYIEKYGVDTLRMYLMFCGRFLAGGDFSDAGIEGMSRFLKRVWRLVAETTLNNTRNNAGVVPRELPQDSAHLMHKTIKKVTEDIEKLSYNTAIAALMEWVNFLEEKVADSSQLTVHSRAKSVNREPITVNEIETLLKLLASFAPHMTEELWQQFFGNPKHEILNPKQIPNTKIENSKIRELVSSQSSKINGKWKVENGNFASIHLAPWPTYDPQLAEATRILLVVEVNGRVRDKIGVERGLGREAALKLALKSERVTKYLVNGQYKKVIFVPDRLINFVV